MDTGSIVIIILLLLLISGAGIVIYLITSFRAKKSSSAEAGEVRIITSAASRSKPLEGESLYQYTETNAKKVCINCQCENSSHALCCEVCGTKL